MADEHAGRPAVDRLDDELRALGRAMVGEPPPAGLVAAVLARIALEPVPARPSTAGRALAAAAAAGEWVRRRWRLAVAIAVGLLLALVVVTPASARIVEWLGLGGVVVVPAPAAESSGPTRRPGPAGPTPTGVETELTLPQARERVPFEVGVPTELGDPDRVLITMDARVVSMVWQTAADGGVRLDQFAGRPDPLFVKKYADDVEFTAVGSSEALWLRRSHPLVYLDADGVQRSETARTSAPSLVWQRGPVTLRLEGVADRDRAIAVASSVSG